MQPTTVTNKNVANGIPAKKRSGKPGDDSPDPGAPVELQNLLQALRAMRAGEKCLDAGASDYLAKSVNSEQLLSTLRSWLHR